MQSPHLKGFNEKNSHREDSSCKCCSHKLHDKRSHNLCQLHKKMNLLPPLRENKIREIIYYNLTQKVTGGVKESMIGVGGWFVLFAHSICTF